MSESKITKLIPSEVEHEVSPHAQITHGRRSHTQTITLSEGAHHHYLKQYGNHGTETFEDVLFHPIREWKAHKKRKEELKIRKANGTAENEKVFEVDSETGSMIPSPKEILIHIKLMSGSHTFKFEDKDLDILASGMHLTSEEKASFKPITDSDELRIHLIETHRAVKMVFDSIIEPGKDIEVISLNDNIFLEVRPVDFDNELEKGYINPKREFFKRPDADLSDNLGEKKASWLELFYDLFYIVSLSQFTHTHHIVDQRSFLVYAGWFIILWWSWMASAIYTTRFDTDDVVHHIFKLIEMFGIVGMAGASNNYYSTDTKGFIIAYMVLKSVLILEYGLIYLYAYMDVKKAASILPLRFFLLANIVALSMWGASLTVETPGKYGLWYGSIAVEVLVNVWFRNNKETSVAKSQLGERIGLLTLIVLGENVIGLVRLLASESRVVLIVCEMMGVTILFGFFYIYFDDFSNDVLAEAKLNYLWIFAHFPLHLFQIAVGIALTDLIDIERISLDPAKPLDKAVTHLVTLFEGAVTGPVGAEHGSSNLTTEHGSSNLTTEHGSSNLTTEHGSSNLTTADESLLTTNEEAHPDLHLNNNFVASTFLVSAALVLFVNAVIKMLHSQLADKNSVIIIVVRLITVVLLLALIAVPYEAWGSALALLGFMTGMMVIQACIDYLD